jgi:AbrB family looped-hinge helix DNA binding protein
MAPAVKIRTMKIGKRGVGQMQITIPRNWLKDHGLKEGDSLELRRDTEDRLIIVPGKKSK